MLAQSQQIRKEAEDTGPLAELEHWRYLTTKFNSILDHIKSSRCRAALNTLNAAKSKLMKV